MGRRKDNKAQAKVKAPEKKGKASGGEKRPKR